MTPDDHTFWQIIRFNYIPSEVQRLDRMFTPSVDIARARYFNMTPAEAARLRWIDNLDSSWLDEGEG